MTAWRRMTSRFLSTSPARGTTTTSSSVCLPTKISIHVPREGDDTNYFCKKRLCIISIHVPREGDDGKVIFRVRETRPISIHVPREGDDSKCDGKYIAFSCNICHNKIQRTKTRCIFVQNATVSAAYLHKYPKNDNRPPVRTVRCFSAHCRLAPAPCRPQRAFLHRCLYTSKISSCAHCGARPTCSTLVLYWLPSR